MHKKILSKSKIAVSVIRSGGVLYFLIRSLQYLEKRRGIKPGVNSDTKVGIDTRANYDEILAADPSEPANASWQGRSKKSVLTFNWLMPPPGKGSGGHMTLFRFIRALEDAGHTCRIYFHNPGPYSTVESVVAIMGDSFTKVKAEMSWLKTTEEMGDADGIFATSWETAYTVYASNVKAKKFYFVQDFEPFFYPVGGHYVLAENTYRLGLRGITAGGWLKKKLNEEYGMTTSAFEFGSDSGVYKINKTLEPRKEIVFYARPYTERRAFEIGILTLDLFHRNNPDYIINFIGWDVSGYSIPFPFKNLGILDPDELNALYNRCAASLVMSLTNMSLLPLELLSSGCIPVVNDGENNRLVSDNRYIAYAQNDPVSLAKKLTEVVTRADLSDYSSEASDSVRNLDWSESGRNFADVVEKAVAAKGDL